MPRKCYLVGLTGSAASGKSEVARRFAALGAEIIDADQLARDAVAPGSDGLSAVRSAFGERFVLADGALDRRALRREVFADPAKRRLLESIVHPRVRRLFDERLAEIARRRGRGTIVVYAVPLLFESRMPEEFDAIVVVASSRERSIERLMSRDSATRREAEALYDSQLPIAEKIARADLVIDNDGTLAELDERAERAYAELVKRAAGKPQARHCKPARKTE